MSFSYILLKKVVVHKIVQCTAVSGVMKKMLRSCLYSHHKLQYTLNVNKKIENRN